MVTGSPLFLMSTCPDVRVCPLYGRPGHESCRVFRAVTPGGSEHFAHMRLTLTTYGANDMTAFIQHVWH